MRWLWYKLKSLCPIILILLILWLVFEGRGNELLDLVKEYAPYLLVL